MSKDQILDFAWAVGFPIVVIAGYVLAGYFLGGTH